MFINSSLIWHFHFPETYNNIFVDSGRSPDSYLNAADIGGYLNESTIFNGTFDVNSTSITETADKNYTAADEEDVAELVVMAVTSIVLGLMILITVIGLYIFFGLYLVCVIRK